jgi:hypothetical protein
MKAFIIFNMICYALGAFGLFFNAVKSNKPHSDCWYLLNVVGNVAAFVWAWRLL